MARALTKALGAAGFAACLVGPAAAQLLPPGQVPGGQPGGYVQQDAANLAVRIDRLENQIRALNGQIEQLQFNNRRLEDTLRKFQQDVEFRLQGQAGGAARPGQPAPQRRGEAETPPPVAAAPASPGGATPQAAPGARP
ncbi:MAG: hypothetical protein JNK46_04855, partial [Methylobacteriaceae bacterium]|nr:hypothetical protein [Methylobacteriaceae bacterium]